MNKREPVDNPKGSWIDCEHKWDSSRDVRLCLSCGQVRQFPSDGKNARIVWPGRGSNVDPSKEDKAAQSSGIKKIAELTGLDWKMLRAWIGAYCRKPKVQEDKPKVQEDKSKPKPAPERKPPRKPRVMKVIPRESVTGSFLPAFPTFNESWPEMVQLRWLDTYRTLALVLRKGEKKEDHHGED